MIRTIMSPGVEWTEVDLSDYVATTIDSFRGLLFGFSDKGEYQVPTKIKNMEEFSEYFGTPTNEAERYSYNSVATIVGTGAECIFVRVPYNGETSKYTYSTYSIQKSTLTSQQISKVINDTVGASSQKPEVDSVYTINHTGSGVSDNIDDFSSKIYNVDGTEVTDPDGEKIEAYGMRIITKYPNAYDTGYVNGVATNALGYVPVMTTAVNALAISNQLKGVTVSGQVSTDEIKTINENYDCVKKHSAGDLFYFTNEMLSSEQEFIHFDSADSGDMSEFGNLAYVDGELDNPTVTTENVYGTTLSRQAAELFPTTPWANTASRISFDHTYFHYIGIVVFKVGVNSETGRITFTPVESYAGSLNRDAVDTRTNSSLFIEDIVNTRSPTIKIQIDDQNTTNLFTPTSTFMMGTQYPVVLGYPKKIGSSNDNEKLIKYTSITSTLERVFSQEDGLMTQGYIDMIVDGGLSTIAQYIYNENDTALSFNPSKVEVPVTENGELATEQWRAIINIFKNYCQNVRRDICFITESPRHFTLIKDQKWIDPRLGDLRKKPVEVMNNINRISGINSSYGWGYSIWYKIADAYTGKTFWTPPSAYGFEAWMTSRKINPWVAPAGIRRATINVSELSFEPNLDSRNTLYSNAWNYAMTYPENGSIVIEGQKTFQTRTSAFDRINVRNLFIYLEKRVINIAKNYIYEPNTAYVRQQFVDAIAPIFESAKSNSGIYDYKIIADESINTDEVIDNNEFRIRIGIKPTKTIEFILIEFTAVRTGSTFEEIEG